MYWGGPCRSRASRLGAAPVRQLLRRRSFQVGGGALVGGRKTGVDQAQCESQQPVMRRKLPAKSW